jgi:hypothetical protein
MEDGVITYFGPYNADVLNQRLPVDHLLFATVEAGDAAVKSNSGNDTPGKPITSCHRNIAVAAQSHDHSMVHARHIHHSH